MNQEINNEGNNGVPNTQQLENNTEVNNEIVKDNVTPEVTSSLETSISETVTEEVKTPVVETSATEEVIPAVETSATEEVKTPAVETSAPASDPKSTKKTNKALPIIAIILVVAIVAVALVVSGVFTKDNNSSNNAGGNVTDNSNNNNENEPETTEYVIDSFTKEVERTITKSELVEGMVNYTILLDAVEKKGDGETATLKASIKLPELTANTTIAKSINDKIKTAIYPEEITDENLLQDITIDYTYKVSDDIVFISITSNYKNYSSSSAIIYSGYYYDIKEDKELTFEEVVTKLGLNYDEMKTQFAGTASKVVEGEFNSATAFTNAINENSISLIPSETSNNVEIKIQSGIYDLSFTMSK